MLYKISKLFTLCTGARKTTKHNNAFLPCEVNFCQPAYFTDMYPIITLLE